MSDTGRGRENDSALTALRAKVEELERLILLSNDAMCALTGMLGRIVVDAGLVTRDELADAIAERAAPVDRDDHNPILMAFGRAVRMNFPGGRFDVIEGGRETSIDPETN
ncbi:MAG TPA: hypothetical protein VF503_28710 [Sphingobium sp.]|uniref:hypothetical protein n=1 Tax=Sphingobium sp. TaxID=1912891 RepID=UPI002ED65D6F